MIDKVEKIKEHIRLGKDPLVYGTFTAKEVLDIEVCLRSSNLTNKEKILNDLKSRIQ